VSAVPSCLLEPIWGSGSSSPWLSARAGLCGRAGKGGRYPSLRPNTWSPATTVASPETCWRSGGSTERSPARAGSHRLCGRGDRGRADGAAAERRPACAVVTSGELFSPGDRPARPQTYAAQALAAAYPWRWTGSETTFKENKSTITDAGRPSRYQDKIARTLRAQRNQLDRHRHRHRHRHRARATKTSQAFPRTSSGSGTRCPPAATPGPSSCPNPEPTTPTSPHKGHMLCSGSSPTNTQGSRHRGSPGPPAHRLFSKIAGA
jgi:hypothetical protein